MAWIDLSKIDVARKQLETAIELFFQEGDPISIHTLGCAAKEILEVLCKKKEIEGLHTMLLSRIVEEKRKFVRDKLTEAQNFFKHANSDPSKKFNFNPDTSTFILWDACSLYKKYTGEFGKNKNLFLFEFWFVLKHRDCFPYLENITQPIRDTEIEDKKTFYIAMSMAHEIVNKEYGK